MDRRDVERITAQWCRDTSTLNPTQCRELARRLAPEVMKRCKLEPAMVASLCNTRFTTRFEAEERLRKCLEHYHIRAARRMSDLEIQRFVGQAWQWITEDLLGIEYKYREPTGTAAGPRG